MKRAHRSFHRLVWVILPLVLAGIIVIALLVRPADPVLETLPESLLEEAL
ncbi:MAG: hypothetical protein AAFO63_07965 [Pseudomonadota bacterium]